jgi:hypothetical protein
MTVSTPVVGRRFMVGSLVGAVFGGLLWAAGSGLLFKAS